MNDISSLYPDFLRWFGLLHPFYQIVVGAFLIWMVKIVTNSFIRVAMQFSKKFKGQRTVDLVFLYAAHKYGLTSKDHRRGIDSMFYIISHSFRFFFAACSIISLYSALSALMNSRIIAFLVFTVAYLLLRESQVRLLSPEKQISKLDPKELEKILSYWDRVDYDAKESDNDEASQEPPKQ